MRPRDQYVAVLRVPVPNEFASLEQFWQYQHADLDAMTPDQIETEHRRLSLFLLFARRPADWHHERLARLEAARRPAGGTSVRRPSPPRTTEWRTW